jgi:hypothetical protein
VELLGRHGPLTAASDSGSRIRRHGNRTMRSVSNANLRVAGCGSAGTFTRLVASTTM